MAKLPIPQEIVSAATRIIYSGFPELRGSTLLQKRSDAKSNHDHIRGRLMLEPRGHREMYGALLVNETELTATGEADIGVLFLHNGGYSTMCGHATIALGRFLVDFDAEACPDLFPTRNLRLDEQTMTTTIKLHCPCGVVPITVPVVNGPHGRLQSNPERPVSFINVDSYATGIDIEITLPEAHRWPELGARTRLTADFCYGGAFYCIVDAEQLGFDDGLKSADNMDALSRATGSLKTALSADPQYKPFFQHSVEQDLGFLYGVIVRDRNRGVPAEGAAGAEVGLCFFGAQQVDRSPCGSGSAARRALAHAKHMWPPEQKWTYHSLLSGACGGVGGFTTHVVGKSTDGQDVPGSAGETVRVQVEGQAFYTSFATFLAEAADGISASGFLL
ncbi:hypothetical protein C8A00DRAFT_33160 [Chaetomidium leptoderma]|uniref:trans-L-3-hydroxyproline dehydratase n=1 Tax=Chaetomidium leptoderma TaxID=669021 RepID=A0AAN6VMT7_9PEZI|nr:hypothetical protein C8A00DRAFT_33160 [Chaetomidium leptoderma]